MAGIDVLASFGIGAAELDAYGQVDSGEAGPPSGSGIPRARRVARSGARQGPRGQILPPPSPGRGLGSCIDAPGLGRLLGNSLPEGSTTRRRPWRRLSPPIQLRAPQEADIPHLRQKRPQEMKEIPKIDRPQEKLENPKI